MEECPICIEPLTGTLATLGCCSKVMHVECFIKCMKMKLDCPMCRSRHENLRMVQDIESQVFVPVAIQLRNINFFRNVFLTSIIATIMLLTVKYGK
jgi:hypothetical protein